MQRNTWYRSRWPWGVAMALVLACGTANSADHSEAPMASADPAADIADLYAWHSGNKLVAALTYAGLSGSMTGPLYDDDVLYTVHVDNDGDNEADIDVLVRFGRNDDGDWGVQVENLPGSDSPLSGPVGTQISAGDGRYVWAGWRDDPFFFDLEGFTTTLQTGTLSFDNTRDSLAGLNISAFVLEMDLADARDGETGPLRVWATTGRK